MSFTSTETNYINGLVYVGLSPLTPRRQRISTKHNARAPASSGGQMPSTNLQKKLMEACAYKPVRVCDDHHHLH